MKTRPKRIHVSYQGQSVGQLATNGRETLFQYSGEWLESGHDLSPKVMPRRSGLFPGNNEDFEYLPPLFADSLPDRYGRLVMLKWFRKQLGDRFQPTPLDKLAYVGASGMGALVYEPEIDTFPKEELRLLNLHVEELASRKLEATSSAALIEKAKRAVKSVGGRFPKILCAEDTATGHLYEDDFRLPRDYRRWIIKFAPEDSPLDSRIEFALNQMARASGLIVPDTRLFSDAASKHAYFGVERFDRLQGERVHFSTLAAVTGQPAADLNLDYRDLFATTFELTRDMEQVREAFARLIFNVAVYNTDDHAKNHAFCYRNGHWTLSPAYDLTFCPGSPGAPALHAMAMSGVHGGITFPMLLKLGEEAGLSRAACRKVVTQVTETVSKANSFFKKADIPVKTAKPILKQLDEGLSALIPPPSSNAKKKH